MWCSCFKPSVLDIAIAQHIAQGRDNRINTAYSSRPNPIEIEQTSRLIKLLRQTATKFSRPPSTARTKINKELTPTILQTLIPLIANPELSHIIIPTLLPLISTLPELVPIVLPTLLPLIKKHPEFAPEILQTLIPVISTLPELATIILPLLLPIIPLIDTTPELAAEFLPTLIPIILLNLESSNTLRSLVCKHKESECEYL